MTSAGHSVHPNVMSSMFAHIDVNKLQRFTVIKEYGMDSDVLSESGDEGQPKIVEHDKEISFQLDYWTIIKAVKFLKIGDQHACLGTLSLLLTFDLQLSSNQYAISYEGGLTTLTNLAEANHQGCRIGALKILAVVAKNRKIAMELVDLGICPVVVKRLLESHPDVLKSAAKVIENVALVHKASADLRAHGAIELLVTHLDVHKEMLVMDDDKLTDHEKDKIRVCIQAAHALWSMSHFKKNKSRLLATGVVKRISTMLLSGNAPVAIPMLGILSSCTTEPMFQYAVESEGLVGVIITDLQTDDAEMQKLCALALARAAGGNEIVREMIRFHHGPEVIMQLIVDTDKSDKRMLTAGISAMWKSAISMENALEYEKLDAVPMLVDFLGETDMSVLIATVGAIGEIAKCDDAREEFISKGAMTDIISLLGHINEDLLVNSAKAVGVCADCESGIIMLDESDGLRLLWSLLKSKSQKVKIEALWAVKPCVSRHRDSGELIRSLMDSLNLLVKMLKNENREVLTAVCAVISEVALDLENLAVMTEQGVVKHLASLVLREPRDVEIADSERRATRGGSGIRFEKLRMRTMLHRELASALANCSMLDDNRRAFGRAGVIPVIVGYLQTRNAELLAQANRALYALSGDHFNCVSIQSCGAVPYLITSVQSACMVTQIAAVGTLKNIRLMLQRSEEKRLAFNCLTKQEREKKLKEIEAIVEMLSGHREPEEDKELILKGHARVSIAPGGKSFGRKKSMSFGGSMAGSEMHTVAFNMMQRHESGIIKKHSSLLSWRERMSLSAIMSKSSRKRSRTDSELSAVLAAKAATEKGTRKLSAGSSSSSDSGTQPTVAH